MTFLRSLLERNRRRYVLLTVFAATSTISLYTIYWDNYVCSACSYQSYTNKDKKPNETDIACKFPYLDPFSPKAYEYFIAFPTSSCPDGLPTVTFYDGDTVYVNKNLRYKHFHNATLACWYRSIAFHKNFVYTKGKWNGPFSDLIAVNHHPPFVEVKCLDDKDQIVSRMHHYITRTERRSSERPVQHAFSDNQMNIMVIGMDSVSSHLFKRAMPKTRQYLLETMGSVELNVYNKIGDNTFPNILAIASGKYVSDIPGWSQAQSFDHVPFIWKEFKSAGYRTQYISDRSDFDVFSLPPTDSYNHPMVMDMMRNKIAFDNNCFEDQIEIQLWLNMIKEFTLESLHNTGRYFSLAMFKRPTHDFPNQASAVDEHYRSFFKDIFENSVLNNTFLVFFGDHGPRKGSFRRTFEGSIEERAANMVIYVPDWFKQNYHQFYGNLLINANRLTTNFDIHETLQCIAKSDFDGRMRHLSHPREKTRGLSLFSTISRERTCNDAQITPHFCLCNGGVPMTNDYPLWTRIGEELVEHLNSLISQRSDVCATIHLQHVTSLLLLAGASGGSGVYRIMIVTDPGGAAFEATLEYSVTLFFISTVKPLGLISRISAYRGLSDCVADDKILRMYCYCKSLL